MTDVRRFLLISLAAWALSCSNQSEGERCDVKSPDDCEGTLVCTDLGQTVTRCCPADGTYTDSRCQPGVTSTGGTAGNGGTSGSSGSSAGGTAGTAGTVSVGGTAGSTSASCTYNHDCASGLVCGASGHCQLECLVDRDCATGLVCQANQCVSSTAGAGGGGAGGAP